MSDRRAVEAPIAVTFEHIIYIPGVLLVGLALGYTMGARAVRAEMKRLQQRMRR